MPIAQMMLTFLVCTLSGFSFGLYPEVFNMMRNYEELGKYKNYIAHTELASTNWLQMKERIPIDDALLLERTLRECVFTRNSIMDYETDHITVEQQDAFIDYFKHVVHIDGATRLSRLEMGGGPIQKEQPYFIWSVGCALELRLGDVYYLVLQTQRPYE